jgi:pimeloyl-ACP methyl ester carboxylesterase
MRDESARRPRPLTFGLPARRLFGIFHPGDGQPAVLLCNAFGQEAIRTHRFMRVLAERLARLGHPVLRFDYYGSGESMGDDTEADLDGWQADLLQADAQLRRLGGTAQRAWFGLRLGGSLALQAAPAAAPGLARVVAWEPVVDGAAYLARLREQHARTLEQAFSLMPSPRPSLQLADPAAYRDEAIGFALPAPMRQQLARLGWPDAATLAAAGAVVIVADPDTADGHAMLAQARTAGPQVSAMVLPQHVDWMRDSADNTPLVPAQALQLLVQQITAAAG